MRLVESGHVEAVEELQDALLRGAGQLPPSAFDASEQLAQLRHKVLAVLRDGRAELGHVAHGDQLLVGGLRARALLAGRRVLRRQRRPRERLQRRGARRPPQRCRRRLSDALRIIRLEYCALVYAL